MSGRECAWSGGGSAQRTHKAQGSKELSDWHLVVARHEDSISKHALDMSSKDFGDTRLLIQRNVSVCDERHYLGAANMRVWEMQTNKATKISGKCASIIRIILVERRFPQQ